jgi:translation initiation factor IF-1
VAAVGAMAIAAAVVVVVSDTNRGSSPGTEWRAAGSDGLFPGIIRPTPPDADLPGLSMEEPIEVEGTVSTVLPGTMFRVKLDNGHEMLAHLSGKMRRHFVRLTVGDRVRLEMSPYDLTKARVTYRLK